MGQHYLESTNVAAGRPTTLLYLLLSATTCTIGELVDFANGLPVEWVAPVAESIGHAVAEDFRHHRHAARRRRQLVVLGALMNRLIFEIECVQRDRDARI